MNSSLDSKLADLQKISDEILSSGEVSLSSYEGKIYGMDLLACAVIKRSVSLISSFILLLKKDDFLSCAHLVRLHLDSVLRFSAAWIVDNPNEFSERVFKGELIKNIKDRDGNKMADWYLVSILKKKEPWIEKLYEDTSGYIHLSSKHIFNAISFEEKDVGVICLSDKGERIPLPNKLEAVEGMIAISHLLLWYLSGWYSTKTNPPKK